MWGSPHLCRDPRKGLSSSHPLPRHRTALSATCDHPPTARTDLPENPLLLELILKPLTHQSPLVPMGAAHSVLAPPPLAPLSSTLEIPWRNQGCQTPGTHIRGAPPGPGTPGIFTQHICRAAFPCQGHPRFWDARLCWLFCCPPPPLPPRPSLSAPICVDTSLGSLALCLLMVSQEVPAGKGRAGGESGHVASHPPSLPWAVVGPLCEPWHAQPQTLFLSSPRCRAGL